jgi:hypothetical protein
LKFLVCIVTSNKLPAAVLPAFHRITEASLYTQHAPFKTDRPRENYFPKSVEREHVKGATYYLFPFDFPLLVFCFLLLCCSLWLFALFAVIVDTWPKKFPHSPSFKSHSAQTIYKDLFHSCGKSGGFRSSRPRKEVWALRWDDVGLRFQPDHRCGGPVPLQLVVVHQQIDSRVSCSMTGWIVGRIFGIPSHESTPRDEGASLPLLVYIHPFSTAHLLLRVRGPSRLTRP